MPANQTSLRVTEVYRDKLLALRSAAQTQATRSWADIDVEDFDASYPVDKLASLIAVMQREATRLSTAYLHAFTESELGKTISITKVDTSQVGTARNGDELRSALRSPLIGVKVAIKDGQPTTEALKEGRTALERMVGLAVDTVARDALSRALLDSPYIAGWRRAVKGTCEACASTAAGTYDNTIRFPVHPGCQCVQEPVVKGVRNRNPRETGQQRFDDLSFEEQNEAYGFEKAQLLRDGRIKLSDLVEHSKLESEPDFITSRALAAVTPLVRSPLSYEERIAKVGKGIDLSKPRQPINDFDELFKQAQQEEKAFQEFLDLGKGLQQRLHADALVERDLATFEEKAAKLSAADRPQVVIAPLKRRSTALEKMKRKGTPEKPYPPEKLTDLNRASVIVNDLDDLPNAVAELREWVAKNPGWQIREFDDGFAGRGAMGYRDLSVSLISPSGHVAELQFHVNNLWAAKFRGGGHKLYEKMRDFDLLGRDLTKAEKAARAKVEQESIDLYTRALPMRVADRVRPEDFTKAVTEARKKTAYQGFLENFTRDDYRRMETYLAEDGKAGGALKPTFDGHKEIVSLFNVGGSQQAGLRMLRRLVSEGGDRVTVVGKKLRSYYEREGFKVTDTLDFTERKGWDLRRFGRPERYVMERTPTPVTASSRTVGKVPEPRIPADDVPGYFDRTIRTAPGPASSAAGRTHPWGYKLTAKQRDVAQRWQGVDGATPNEFLRAGKPLFEHDQKFVDQMDELMNAAGPVGHDLQVFRGTPSQIIEEQYGKIEDMVGKTFTDKGFVATSPNKDQIKNWAHPGLFDENKARVYWNLTVDKNVKGVWEEAATGENWGLQELVLQRDCRFVITKVNKTEKGNWRISANVLPPKQAAKLPKVTEKVGKQVDEVIPAEQLQGFEQDALQSIKEVHRVPSKMVRPEIDHPAFIDADPGIDGQFGYIPDGTRTRLLFAPGHEERGYTFTHELGHAVDHALGPQAGFATHVGGELTKEWERAVTGSQTYKKLVEFNQPGATLRADLPGMENVPMAVPEGHVAYLLAPEELWARSYAQWITTRAKNPELKKRLADLQREQITQGKMLPEVWSDQDFAPIAKAFDKIFRKQKLLNEGAVKPLPKPKPVEEAPQEPLVGAVTSDSKLPSGAIKGEFQAYQGGVWEVNGELRAGGKLSPKVEKTVRALDQGLAEAPPLEEQALWRGTTFDAVAEKLGIKDAGNLTDAQLRQRLVQSMPGKTLTDLGFGSTSKERAQAVDFATLLDDSTANLVWELKVDPRVRGIDMNDLFPGSEFEPQQEVLLERGLRYVVEDVNFSSKYMEVRVRVLPSEKTLQEGVQATMDAAQEALRTSNSVPARLATKFNRQAAVEDALKDIDKAHKWPDAAEIPIYAKPQLRARGQFRREKATGVPREIFINDGLSGGATGHTLTHEMGHFLDSILGKSGKYASELGEMDDLVKVAMESGHMKYMLSAATPKQASYLASPKEIWSRAYAQWLGGGLRGNPNDWPADQFAPIGEAVEAVLRKARLLLDAKS